MKMMSLGTRWNGGQVATAYKKLQEGERFIGLGEKNGPLDRKGRGLYKLEHG
jgi:alpha-glucosidase